MTKKLALVLAILMVLGLCLTACKSDDTNADDTATQAPATQAPSTTAGADATAPAETGDVVENTTGDANSTPPVFPVCIEKETGKFCQPLHLRSRYLHELYIVQQPGHHHVSYRL
jgi:hypothetical protein